MRLTLHAYLFVCLGIIAVVPILIMGAVRMQRAETSQIERSDRETTLAAQAMAREAAQIMQAHTNAVRALSRQVEVTGTLDPLALQPVVTAQHSSAQTLGNMWVANAAGTSLAVDPPTDAQGKPAAGTDYSDRDYYKKLVRTQATTYSRAQLGRTTHRPNLQIVEPIRDRSGNFVGLSQGAVDLAEIQALTDAVSGAASGLHVVVLDSDGRVLAHPDPAAREIMLDLAEVDLFQSPAGLGTELRVGRNELGEVMRVAAAPVTLGGLNWTVVVGRTQSALDLAVTRTRDETLFLAGISLLAGLAIAGALASLLARPIVKLSAVAAAVGRGDLTVATPAPRSGLPHQVNVLLEAVGDMVVQLRVRTTELEHLATHDPLTSLPNRALLSDRLEQALLAAARDGRPLALLLIDLDRFKEVNDTFGHPAGDRLLQDVAQRLREVVRESDSIARLGGDEFAIVLPGMSAQGAERLAGFLIEAVTRPFVVEGLHIEVGLSIGAALYPDHGTNAAVLQRQADVAMFTAKRDQLGFAMYVPDLDAHSPDRLGLVADLRRAILGDELVLHYQPLMEIDTGRSTCVEALVRWQHPQRGLVSPDEFISLAEETGLIRPLSKWVLDHALQQCREWRDAALEVAVAVNLSMRNLQDEELPETLEFLLKKWQVPSSQLRIEVTESSLMANPTRVMGVLTRIHDMGVLIAIDDFGTGYSSLAYLKRLPVDELKIDQSFVRDMVVDSEDAAIVRSTISLAHELGLKVIAEGVEDKATWDLLAGQNCDLIQGYYLSRPLPVARATAWLSADRAPRIAAA
jgi:diguanylate cyclase (GGDEF)-like protein